MANKQLVVAVEATAAMAPFWQTILHDYLEKIIWSFCGTEVTGQKLSAPNVQLSLVTFSDHGANSAFLVGRSGWTRDMDTFLQWLSTISFAGGGFNNAAIAEGLADALMMLNGSQSQQNVDNLRHCILVAASNPYTLPTPVYRPQLKNLEKNGSVEGQPESRLFDAEAIAKFFPQLSVSLSVICPKQLPKLRAIYNSGKRNTGAADPPIDTVKNPYYLVLISENFLEARATLSLPGTNPNLALNHSPVKMNITSLPLVSGPPSASIPLANGSALNRQQHVSVGTFTPAAVKVEPTTMTHMVPGPTFQHIPSVPHAVPTFPSGTSNMSQALGNIQGGVSMGQPIPSIPSMMSAMGSSGTMMPTPGMGLQGPGMFNNNTSANMLLSQQTSSALQSAQSQYVKVWEGNLFGRRQGQPVFVTRLEGYRRASHSETLAANWPTTMQIVRLISQVHMNNKQYVGKGNCLVFRAMNQHGFFGQLKERKLCAVIQLPSQTLLLSVSDKVCRLIGMLFPGDIVVFTQSHLQEQQMQQQQQPMQQQMQEQMQQMQEQMQLMQQQQMGQGYDQVQADPN